MKTLCITSTAHPALQTIAEQLFKRGLAPAYPAQRGEGLDIASWHQRVLAKHPNGVKGAHLGRLWEQLATDIFMANLDSPTWGWSDSHSVELLDFWHPFDPHLYFVLICISPLQAIAHAITAQEGSLSIDDAMQQWQTSHQAMLRFHLRHPERSVLISAEAALAQGPQLLETLARRWNLDLPETSSTLEVHAPSVFSDPVADFLAQQLIANRSAEHALHQEILASITPLALDTPATPDITIGDALAAYRQLRGHSHLASELQQQIERLTQEQDSLSTALHSVKEESELLLLQLHQVQEELENVFLKEQQATQQLNASQAELASLRAAGEALKKQISELGKARDEQARLANERLAKLEAFQQEKDTLNTDLKDARDEAELLLLQLHQVQEELEHYFLEHQKLQQDLQAWEARWQRMLQRTPGYCDYGNLSVASGNEPTTLDWTFSDLETAGRRMAQLHCQTRVIDGHAAILLKRTPDGQQLLRWPAPADSNAILLAPGIEAARDSLARLATSDLLLIKNLAGTIEQSLGNSAALQLPAEVPAASLQTAFQQFAKQLGAQPATLRYDRISLKNNQTNPDYEHLWLVLDNLSFGTQQWPQFEFRLSCANVGPQRFGSHPKLELPRHTGQAPLPGWFAESYDDHGAKLELRFALPDAMDIQTWTQLGNVDQHFMSALCNVLPAILNDLQASGAQISRAWQDWHNLAENVQRILALCAPETSQLQDAV